MATTYLENGTNTPNGSHLWFSYSFPVLKTEDVKVALNGVTQATTKYAVDNTSNPTRITFNATSIDSTLQESTTAGGKVAGAPKTGVVVRVYRDTDVDSAKAVYAAGSSIRALDLNNNHDQVLYALQEEQNQRDWSGSKTVEKQLKIKSTAGVVADGGTYTINGGHITIGNDDTNALQLFHDSLGNGSFISEVGPGDLSIVTNGTNLFLQKDATAGHAEDMIVCIANGPVKLFHDNVQKLITESTGVDITGTVKADGATIDGNSTLNGNLVVTGTISDSGGNLELSDDVNISGHLRFPDDKKIYLGNGDDASIDWDTDGWFDRLEITSAGDTQFKVGSGKHYTFFVDSAIPLQIYETYIGPRVDFKPYPSNAVDLGKSDGQWKDLYVDGTGYIDTVNADDITGSAIVTSGTSTSDTKVYSAKRSDALYFAKASGEEISSGETWVADDNKIATTAAIDARIIDLVDDVGGFVPIANETSFPNANPDVNNGAGTLVSVPLANNLTSNGSGVISISNGTVGNSTVTINGAAASTTYSTGFGIIVETTTTLNTYTFHRYVPKATEVTTVAGSITNVNAVAGNASNINAVAGNASNINSVAGNASNINSAVSNASNINSAVSNASNINSAVSNASNINTVAGIADNVTTVSGISSDVTAVAGDAADIGACSTNIGSIAAIGSDLANNFENISDYGSITGAVTSTSGTSDISTLASGSNLTNIATVAGKATEIGRLGTADAVADMALLGTTACVADMAILGTTDVVSDLNTLATADVVSDLNTLATAAIVSDMDTLADISTNITTVSDNKDSVTTCASNISNINNASTHAANALAYRNAASAILTQVDSAPYNLADNVSSHTAWGEITDTGANAVFTNETSNTLLTMAEGSSNYNYGSIT